MPLGLLVLLLLFLAGAVRFMTSMPGSGRVDPELLAAVDEDRIERLRATVELLAGTIGPRNLERPGTLEAAADWIEARLVESGLPVISFTQRVADTDCRIIEATLQGTDPDAPSLVVGAHYDSCADAPGANDNATGVAAVIELARILAAGGNRRGTIRLVAFPNEEPPRFLTEEMGSRHYARLLHERGERLSTMISLESLGCYSDQPGSQRYPALIGWLYPDRGDFVALVGNVLSRNVVHRAVALFRGTARISSEGAALPGFLPGIGWSDHWSFWQEGYRAFMVTDTALFRDRRYHTPDDRPEHVDYRRLAAVVESLAPVLVGFAEEGAGGAR